MILMFVKLILVVILAFLAGKLISKLKLPAILGWLIAGMLLGPHAFSQMNQEILDAGWYQVMIHVLECGVGLMIGTDVSVFCFWRNCACNGSRTGTFNCA